MVGEFHPPKNVLYTLRPTHQQQGFLNTEKTLLDWDVTSGFHDTGGIMRI